MLRICSNRIVYLGVCALLHLSPKKSLKFCRSRLASRSVTSRNLTHHNHHYHHHHHLLRPPPHIAHKPLPSPVRRLPYTPTPIQYYSPTKLGVLDSSISTTPPASHCTCRCAATLSIPFSILSLQYSRKARQTRRGLILYISSPKSLQRSDLCSTRTNICHTLYGHRRRTPDLQTLEAVACPWSPLPLPSIHPTSSILYPLTSPRPPPTTPTRSFYFALSRTTITRLWTGVPPSIRSQVCLHHIHTLSPNPSLKIPPQIIHLLHSRPIPSKKHDQLQNTLSNTPPQRALRVLFQNTVSVSNTTQVAAIAAAAEQWLNNHQVRHLCKSVKIPKSSLTRTFL